MGTTTTTAESTGRRRTGARPYGAPGVKVLVSSLALAATLAGWGWLAAAPAPPAPAETEPGPPPVVVAARSASYQVPPLPTLVPLLAPLRTSARSARPAAPVAAPVDGNALLATLRQVSAPPPPEPVAVTRSSR